MLIVSALLQPPLCQNAFRYSTPQRSSHTKNSILTTTVFVALHTLKSLGGFVAIEYLQNVRHLSVNRHSQRPSRAASAFKFAWCYSMYAFWLKPRSLPNAAYIDNAGWNWNCGPMTCNAIVKDFQQLSKLCAKC
ncbi:hypothetical protein B0H19DRAFT_1083818 [Mycena capillaripes]|nr:hypothetical protein B0H19DRAFT_1083818 [Mycena capillaripes]